jgi:hypothetical protein
MLIAILTSFALSVSPPDSTPHCLTLNELLESGSVKRINELNTISFFGPSYSMFTHEQEQTKKRTIGFRWDVDSVSYLQFEKIEKTARAFSDLINIYFLGEKQLRYLDEILIVVTCQGDTTKYHSFNFLIDHSLKYLNYEVDKKVKLLKDLSVCEIQGATSTDLNNQLKSILYMNIIVPDIVVSSENEIQPLKDTLTKVVKNFILSNNREYYSKCQLSFVGQHGGKKEYTFLISKPQNESL